MRHGGAPCEREVDREHDGQAYFFCNERCLIGSAQDLAITWIPGPTWRRHRPRRHLRLRPGRAPNTPARCIREIVRDAPGRCPICGMALEPRTARPRKSPNPELVDMTRRLLGQRSRSTAARCCCSRWPSMIPAVPLRTCARRAPCAWVELALATPVVLWGGWPFFARGWRSLVNRSLNMFTLIAHRHRRRVRLQRRRDARPGHLSRLVPRRCTAPSAVYFEAAAVITDARPARAGARAPRAPSRTGSAIRALLGLAPKTARRRPRRRRRGRRAARPGRSRATGCGSAPARRCPVDGVVLGGREHRRRVDDHRRADAGRERRREPASSAAPSTARAAS